ncbi:MAG: radical SAM protein [Candidatus Omnitrophica bacterium]|nr:radical SAM protein [Candidatus Omnitrophota bacterium]
MTYFYGPVFSRRLGFSLGVDLFPRKTCSFDCIYCQLGRNTKKVTRRISCVELAKLKQELKTIIKKKLRIDFITISGSGEPTLHKDLNKIIKVIKTTTNNKYSVCVITNSSLLYRKDVRKELRAADVIIPSLDAASAKVFHKINKPYKGADLNKLSQGIVKLSQEFKGQIWLEVMLVKGINDNLSEIKKLKKIIEKISPSRVQLNLPVRPAAVKVNLPSAKKLVQIRKIIGFDAEVVSDVYDGRKEFTASTSR